MDSELDPAKAMSKKPLLSTHHLVSQNLVRRTAVRDSLPSTMSAIYQKQCREDIGTIAWLTSQGAKEVD